jgi:uncharacterized protein (DUF2147 family)
MNKLFLWLTILICSTAFTFNHSGNPDAVVGTWLTSDKNGKIQIYKEGNKYFGKIVWGKENRKDTHNPDPALRSRDLLGSVILSNFVHAGGNKWEDGKIYDPNNGKKYSCNMKLKDNNTLEIRGYIGISLFGRTEVWTRL